MYRLVVNPVIKPAARVSTHSSSIYLVSFSSPHFSSSVREMLTYRMAETTIHRGLELTGSSAKVSTRHTCPERTRERSKSIYRVNLPSVSRSPTNTSAMANIMYVTSPGTPKVLKKRLIVYLSMGSPSAVHLGEKGLFRPPLEFEEHCFFRFYGAQEYGAHTAQIGT